MTKYLGMAAAVAVVGLAAAALIPMGREDRLAALLGVGLSVAAGLVALALKRNALAKGLNQALAMVGVAFAIRMVLVGAGLVGVIKAGLGSVAFTVGFFGPYLALQWIEITYVMAEAKKTGRGGRE